MGTVDEATANDLVSDLRGGGDVVVAVHGSARLVRALLLRAAFTLALAAIGWFFAMLLGSAMASADETPPDLFSGLAETSSMVTGPVSMAVAPAVMPSAPDAVAPPLPEPAAAPAPAAPAARVKPAVRRAVPKPKVLAPKHKAPAVLAEAPPPSAAPAATAKPEPIRDHEANRSGKQPEPPKAPPAPAGSVTSTHDGGSQARGGSGVLTASVTPRPLTEECRTDGRARDASSRAAGLPVASPD